MKKMNKPRFGMSGIVMAMVMMSLSLLLWPAPSQAAVDCSTVTVDSTTDTDGDGFTDYQECTGIRLIDGSTFIPGKLNCAGQTNCLDPDTRDLFVILAPAASNSPMATLPNPLEFLSNPQSQGGLGLRVHPITASQADPGRYLTAAKTQKAVKVTESLDNTPGSVVLGSSSCGTPNGLDMAMVYTQRIITQVQTVTKAADQNLINNYIKHTIAHEIGHMIGPLASTYNSNYGGYHYKSGTNVIMDQAVYYKGTTFYMGNTYTSADQTKIKLR